MAIVTFAPVRLASLDELQPFERLFVELSSTFSTLDADAVDAAVTRAVAEIGTAFVVEECTLISFRPGAGASVVHSWAAPPRDPCRDEDLTRMPWLLQRLARNAVVAFSPEMDLPQLAAEDRLYARETGIVARLGVPIALGTRVAYGLIVGRQRHGDWPTPLVDRLRLAGEIVGNGLERRRLSDRDGGAVEREPHDNQDAAAEARYLREEARNQIESDQIIGESHGFRAAITRLRQVAPLDATVLLLGETGTGKELFARALHDRSRRRARTLIRVNCAALPPSLIESELFGHERGAFTGAIATRQGRFELADGGTILLDEIGDLAPELQAKLLRVLQEGEFERVGSSKVRRVDVRVIAATNVDLAAAVTAGRFRADLFYRLSVFPIDIPPLRERRDDIPQLVWFFVHRRQRELRRRITRIPAAVMQALQHHDWPGNVRELENVIERALICSVDGTLQLDDPLRADRTRPLDDPPRVDRTRPPDDPPRVDRTRPPDDPLRADHARPVSPCGDALDAMQRWHIERVLRECGGKIYGVGNAAERLAMHPNTLRFRMKKLGVLLPARQRADPGGAPARS